MDGGWRVPSINVIFGGAVKARESTSCVLLIVSCEFGWVRFWRQKWHFRNGAPMYFLCLEKYSISASWEDHPHSTLRRKLSVSRDWQRDGLSRPETTLPDSRKWTTITCRISARKVFSCGWKSSHEAEIVVRSKMNADLLFQEMSVALRVSMFFCWLLTLMCFLLHRKYYKFQFICNTPFFLKWTSVFGTSKIKMQNGPKGFQKLFSLGFSVAFVELSLRFCLKRSSFAF
jgi:hypothetical protein